MSSTYIEIDATFATTNEGYTVDVNKFHSIQTIDGRHVCAANSVNEFPAIFEGLTFDEFQLEVDAFPEMPFNEFGR